MIVKYFFSNVCEDLRVQNGHVTTSVHVLSTFKSGLQDNTDFYVSVYFVHFFFFLLSDLDLCPEGQFRCLSDFNTETCFPAELRCNGFFDVCDDGSDEFGCKCSKCWFTELLANWSDLWFDWVFRVEMNGCNSFLGGVFWVFESWIGNPHGRNLLCIIDGGFLVDTSFCPLAFTLCWVCVTMRTEALWWSWW